jgi:PEP-CTERM motif
LQLAGKLDVVLINPGFTLARGEHFDLLNAPAIEGQFSSISLPALPTGLSWDSSQLYSSGVISVVPEPATATLMAIAGAVVALASLVARRRRVNNGRVKAGAASTYSR